MVGLKVAIDTIESRTKLIVFKKNIVQLMTGACVMYKDRVTGIKIITSVSKLLTSYNVIEFISCRIKKLNFHDTIFVCLFV